MGLDGHRARQRWVGLGAVYIFLNPAFPFLNGFYMVDLRILSSYFPAVFTGK